VDHEEASLKEASREIEISIVIPVCSEEETLPFLLPRLVDVLKGVGCSHEIIFVDDGSLDESRKVLKEMRRQYPLLRIIGLKANYGLSAALLAGIREARGRLIVTLDSDLQNDPADIPKLLKYLDEYDMATGWRQKRNDPWLKRVSSKIANAIRNRLSGEDIHDSACTFRIFRRKCVTGIPVFDGMHRFLPTLVRMEGFRVIEVPVSHSPRRFGKSKFNIRNRIWRSWIDLLAVKWMKSRWIRYEIEERN
jgi:dolichol-phosphate mannosyltransferase